jgi:hypothetical protein
MDAADLYSKLGAYAKAKEVTYDKQSVCLFFVGAGGLRGTGPRADGPATGDVLEKVDMGTIEKLRDEGLNHSHIPEDARYLTDVIGPRLTGSPSMRPLFSMVCGLFCKNSRGWGVCVRNPS